VHLAICQLLSYIEIIVNLVSDLSLFWHLVFGLRELVVTLALTVALIFGI